MGTALPTAGETVSLWDTTVIGIENLIPSHGLEYVVADIENSHPGTVQAFWSVDGGTTWVEFRSHGLIAATASSTNRMEIAISPYRDVKVVFIGHSTTQTTFNVNVSTTDERDGVSPLSMGGGEKLLMWYDIADSSTTTTTGAGISNVKDKSGNGYDIGQTTDADRPALTQLNGRDALVFDNGNHLHQDSAATVALPTATFVSVFRDTRAADSVSYLLRFGDIFLLINAATLQITDATGTKDTNAALGADRGHIVVWQCDSATVSKCLVDGVQFGDTFAYDVTSSMSGNMGIGASANGTIPCEADMGEFLVFTPALTDAELEDLTVNYLQPKWKIEPNPTSYPGLAHWFRGDLGVTTTGLGVSAWVNQAEASADMAQTTDSARPGYTGITINGRQALEFDGSEFVTASAPGDVISVAPAGATMVMVWQDYGTAGLNGWAMRSGSVQLIFQDGDGTVAVKMGGTSDTGATIDTDPHIVTAQMNHATESVVALEGTQLGADVSVGADVLDGEFTLGASGGAGSNFTEGKMGEFAVFIPALSDAQLADLLARYLQPHWKIT